MSPTTTQPDQDTQILALVNAQAAIREKLTVRAVTVATRSAESFTGWYDSGQITEWAAGLAGQVEAIQRLLAQSTDAYLARVLSLMTGSRVRPVGRVDVDSLRKGVTHPGSYGRAADTYRWQQSRLDTYTRSLLTTESPVPPDLSSPVGTAVLRVANVADMDAQLAVQAQSQRVMETAHDKGLVTGYRRVIHPEESRGGSCGLCVAASDRLYKVQDLLPIHFRCHCTVLPVVGEADPGSTLNKADLKRLYKEAGGTDRAALKATRYQVDEHGELGPVLNRFGTPVRTARQATADVTSTDRKPLTGAAKIARLTTIRDSLSEALPKAQQQLSQGDPNWTAYLHQLEARIADLDSQLAVPVAA